MGREQFPLGPGFLFFHSQGGKFPLGPGCCSSTEGCPGDCHTHIARQQTMGRLSLCLSAGAPKEWLEQIISFLKRGSGSWAESRYSVLVLVKRTSFSLDRSPREVKIKTNVAPLLSEGIDSVYPVMGGHSAPCVIARHQTWTSCERRASVFLWSLPGNRRPVSQADGSWCVTASVS